MNLQNNSDLRYIYGDSINPQLLDQLRINLLTFKSANEDIPISFELKTKYFSAFYRGRNKPVFIAGGMEKDENKNLYPIIRFDENNSSIKLVKEFLLEYHKDRDEQKSNRICVKLREETIALIPILLWCQLQWFIGEYYKK